MITLGETTYDISDPVTLLVLLGLIVAALVVVLLIVSVRRAGAQARSVAEVAQQVGRLNMDVQTLGQGQQQLSGSLLQVSETQAKVSENVTRQMGEVKLHVNERLSENIARSQRAMVEMQERMKESLHGNSEKTTKSLTELQERLATIDKAQDNITKLSGDVLSLQDILSNKQTRGAFGEIQLSDIVRKALPSDSYALQATLTNGKRADCLIHLPNPPGPIVIDAKFPLEAYEEYTRAEGRDAQDRALKTLGAAVRVHIKAISEKYIIEGETADGALMFLPSEAVYAELHARLPHIVREGFDARVWIVSPTTCMATLNTMRAILKDARMREQAGTIRKALKQLHRDVEIIGEKAGKLEVHLRQAGDDVGGILTASTRAGKRADRLDNFDFEELAPDDETPNVVPLTPPKG
ncbi:DNA recombination protein RmuC [Octadecabacter sp. R77987]|uniref:DNA recombination protein RmuC n=1 Tax=Octadecabacter sp. R77987 TaxID=3093874 RepID=UPI0036723757